MNRSEAKDFVKEWVSSEPLRRHLLTVSCVMEAAARQAGLPDVAAPEEDSVESWGIVGLLHDVDYERFPTMEDHPFRGVEALKERGVPANWTDAIMGHALHTGVARVTPMARTLFAVDELCGFMTAVALVRPSKKIADVKVKSVKKKLKDKGFARGCSREDIQRGVEELGVDADEHFAFVLASLQESAERWESALDL